MFLHKNSLCEAHMVGEVQASDRKATLIYAQMSSVVTERVGFSKSVPFVLQT